MPDFEVFDKQKHDDAISDICDYFNDKGLNLSSGGTCAGRSSAR